MDDAQDVKDSATQLILDRAVGQASDQDADMYVSYRDTGWETKVRDGASGFRISLRKVAPLVRASSTYMDRNRIK